jgi:hypothetical protein
MYLFRYKVNRMVSLDEGVETKESPHTPEPETVAGRGKKAKSCSHATSNHVERKIHCTGLGLLN